jgi:hypothetical protein
MNQRLVKKKRGSLNDRLLSSFPRKYGVRRLLFLLLETSRREGENYMSELENYNIELKNALSVRIALLNKAEAKIAEALKILEADRNHLEAQIEAKRLFGANPIHTPESILKLVEEVQKCLANERKPNLWTQ